MTGFARNTAGEAYAPTICRTPCHERLVRATPWTLPVATNILLTQVYAVVTIIAGAYTCSSQQSTYRLSALQCNAITFGVTSSNA